MQRRGPLAWNQQFAWVAHETAALDPANLSVVLTLPTSPGTRVDVVRAACDAVVARHQALRTTFWYDHETHSVVQEVHEPGPTGYPIRIADADHTGATKWLYERTDLAHEWPIRLLIVVNGARVHSAQLAVHRVVLDYQGKQVLLEELQAALEAARNERMIELPPVTDHPLDVAAFEASSQGQRQHHRSLDYWRNQLRRCPPSLVPVARISTVGDSLIRVQLLSSRLYVTMRRLAQRYGANTPTLVSSIALLILSWVTGRDEVWASQVASNRTRAGVRRTVGSLTDRGLLSVSVGHGMHFSQWLTHVESASIKAYRYSYYDPNELRGLTAQIGLERGIYSHRLPTLSVVQERVPHKADDSRASVEDVRVDRRPVPFDALHYRAIIGRRVLLAEVIVGEHLTEEDTARDMIRMMSSTLDILDDSDDPALANLRTAVAPTVVPVPLGAAPIGDGWVDLQAIATRLRAHPGVAEAAVFVTDEVLAAFVTVPRGGGSGSPTAAELWRWVYVELPTCSLLRCPQRFVICRSTPADTTDLGQWERQEVLIDAAGYPGPILQPQSQADTVLVNALVATHPELSAQRVDLGLPYVLNGGRLERVPAFLAALAGYGWHGIVPDDVVGWRLLADLASSLTLGPEPTAEGG